MWHIETDFFALAIFLVMLIKEKTKQQLGQDVEGQAFYMVLLISIINVCIDIVSSYAMNHMPGWWFYELTMTIYVATMPLLAAVWMAYSYVLIHKDFQRKQLRRNIFCMMIPYMVYIALACTNPVTGLFFSLSPEMDYSRGPLFMSVGVGYIMAYSAAGLLMVIWNRKKLVPKINAVLLSLFFGTTACFIWVQLANPGWLIINASYATIYVWCDLTVEEHRREILYKQLHQKNKELKITAEKAESAAHAKTEFLSRMSHDIRTPMNAVIGLTNLARQESDVTVIRGYLDKIASSSDFLLGLINDILDMSKIENGDLTLHEEPLTREVFATSINTVIRPLMEERKIRFDCQLNGPGCILVDHLRFNQIFFNLLSNAAKFTPEGGKVSMTSDILSRNDQKVRLHICVRDNGIGMSEEFLEHLYDPFSQEKSELTAQTIGTGLGLPIVKSLVDAMGGTISVKSKLGEGTEFTVELEALTADAGEHENVVSLTEKSLRDARILLVEDNEINVYVAQLILERVGCVVYTAENGKEAVERFEASESGWYQAILMDVRMPVMDGITATQEIRALDRPDAKTVPIIAMTAEAFAEEQKRTIEAGMNDHLSKPIDPQLLYETLAEYIHI
ncbi:ATP-binding protein [uncultured Eubacterium sp.]|uniref:ATP-binding protein n=1 Tax=uncultured Eubacterium sp. TaxID=165185 RepID=UPI0025F34869|nr:ATP-binding protein [uncultured Eubacterium sp.]